MPEPLNRWVGQDESGGIQSPERPDTDAPPHWRIEAVAATERPRDLDLSPDGTRAVLVIDRDTSDLWILDLSTGVPRRLTTGREPAPFWEDTAPVWSPDGSLVAYADQGGIWVVPSAGGPPRRLASAGSPVWLDSTRLVVSVEHERSTTLAILSVDDPLPSTLVRGSGDCGEVTVSPDGRHVAFTFSPHDDRNRSEIRVVDVATTEVRALTGTAGVHDRGPVWSPDGSTIAFASERTGWYEVHVVGLDGTPAHQVTSDASDFAALQFLDLESLVATRTRAGVADLVTLRVGGDVALLAAGGTWANPRALPDGSVLATHEAHDQPPRVCIVASDGSVRPLLDPAPLSIAVAPHAHPEVVSYPSFDGTAVPGFLFRPTTASADAPVAAIVYPHGGPTSYYGDEWDGHAQYFVDKGYAWFAVNFRGSTGYGRTFERMNHGEWGVSDTKDCLSAHDYLSSLDWIDPRRVAIFGGSYGSYLALLSVTDDPLHRFAAAVCKYGDCDILTSWAQGDRDGRQDLERMMGHPSTARDEYRAGSPVHRLSGVEVPLLIAHGERDERVHPAQSEELVTVLRRLGKQFEYLTYPTEGHGLLRAGPQIHFYRRLERFLDWYLL
ncbi:MAG: prolyl oligopeptidase family serine peptidase [Acidimicrobiia bacterium]|nr:prolyl oligopeptidase family serine peptidase [Acidimicrobiia bacterium]